MILIITSFVCLCAVLISWLVLIWNSKWYNIPGPFPLPIIGNGLHFMTKSSESIMGVPIDAQINTESNYVKSIQTVAKIIMTRIQNPIFGADVIFNLTKDKKIHDDAIETLHKFTTDVIQARRKELVHSKMTKKNDNSELGIKNKFAFLDSLLLTEINGKQINEKHIREEVDTFMFEGPDTISSGIAFAVYCISKNKEIQEKILEEQKSILGDDLTKDPEYSDLKQMKYLDMVMKESLRLYPAVPLIERINEKNREIGGIMVRKNTAIVINILELHRHPDLYENPLEFNPERFNSSSESGKPNNAFNWLAFSAGLRNCIGQKFALTAMKMTVAGIIKQFEVLPSGEDPILCAELTLRSDNGINVALKKRP